MDSMTIIVLIVCVATLITSIHCYNLLRKLKKPKKVIINRGVNQFRQDILNGIETNQFILHYQPQYSLTQNRVVGVEALVRWKHPDKGFIPPNKFIPRAEMTELINPLGYHILSEACKEHRNLGNPDITVSVNVSAKQLQQEDFVEETLKILREQGLDPVNLNLEITETVAVDNKDKTRELLKQLRGSGISISLDDFGIGYSTILALSELPITSLKIDRTLIANIGDNPEGELILKTTIELAKQLNLKVVAEGVETQEQVDFLKTTSCDEIQGYYYSPPIPSEKLKDFLLKNVS